MKHLVLLGIMWLCGLMTVVAQNVPQVIPALQQWKPAKGKMVLPEPGKGIISSAIALDMEEIGRYSVNALEEFSSLGHTSNYYSVGQHVITRSNVGAYRTEGN